VQFRVIGPDTKTVREIAYKVRDIMKENPNVKEPHSTGTSSSPYLSWSSIRTAAARWV